jgi:hypothetical protein
MEVQFLGKFFAKDQFGTSTFGPDTVTSLMEFALRNNNGTIDGQTVPFPFQPDALQLATDLRSEWQRASLGGIRFHNMYGQGLQKELSVQYTSDVNSISDLFDADVQYVYVDGDETVTLQSAMGYGPFGWSPVTNRGYNSSHTGLLQDPHVIQDVLALLQH